MSEFTAITSQEQLDSVIGDRLKRSEEKWSKKYEGYVSPDDVTAQTKELEKKIAELNTALESASKQIESNSQELAERDKKIRSFEVRDLKQSKILEAGFSLDAIDLVQGEDEETITASIDALRKFKGTSHPTPAFSSEPPVEGDKKKAAYQSMLKDLV